MKKKKKQNKRTDFSIGDLVAATKQDLVVMSNHLLIPKGTIMMFLSNDDTGVLKHIFEEHYKLFYSNQTFYVSSSVELTRVGQGI